MICGNQRFFAPVEEKLADLKGTESELIFNTGFQANVSILPALVDRDSLILSDRLNHNSLIQGARLGRCRIDIFDHNDLDHLQQLLRSHQDRNFSRILIVTESIFSMDGDQCPLDGVRIGLSNFELPDPSPYSHLIIEGAGGVMVPLNDRHFMLDLITKLGVPVILGASPAGWERSTFKEMGHFFLQPSDFRPPYR